MSPRAASRNASSQELRAAVVERLRPRQSEILDAIVARIRGVRPDSAAERDSRYRDGDLAACVECIEYALTGIELGPQGSAPVPAAAIAQARHASRSQVALETVLLCYNAGHRVIGEFVMEEAPQLPPQALRHLIDLQWSLFERLIATVAAEYKRSDERRLLERVQGALAGESRDLDDVGYSVHAWHLGVIATGAHARKAIRGLPASFDCQLLRVSRDQETVWAWFGASQRPKIMEVQSALSPDLAAGEILAVGGPGRGLDGLRQTHREARGAHLQALCTSEQVVRYAASPLLIAALENETLATWLRQFLAPIRGRPDSDALLDTLRAYIDAECNRSSAAAVAKVRRQTVGNRLRLAETLLGRPLSSCLAELDVALRLANLPSEET
jgi:hypothetical protein